MNPNARLLIIGTLLVVSAVVVVILWNQSSRVGDDYASYAIPIVLRLPKQDNIRFVALLKEGGDTQEVFRLGNEWPRGRKSDNRAKGITLTTSPRTFRICLYAHAAGRAYRILQCLCVPRVEGTPALPILKSTPSYNTKNLIENADISGRPVIPQGPMPGTIGQPGYLEKTETLVYQSDRVGLPRLIELTLKGQLDSGIPVPGIQIIYRLELY